MDGGRPVSSLAGGQREPAPAARPRKRRPLLIAGATGALGNEVMRRLVGLRSLRDRAGAGARADRATGCAACRRCVVPERRSRNGRRSQADVGVMLFDPPRLFYDRERALWTPDARAVAGAGALAARQRRAHAGRGAAACPGPAARGAQARAGRPGRAGRGGARLRAAADRALGAKAGRRAPAHPARAAGRTGCCPSQVHGAQPASSRCARRRWPSWWTWRCASRRRASTSPRPNWCGGRRRATLRSGGRHWLQPSLDAEAKSRNPTALHAPKTKLQAATSKATPTTSRPPSTTRCSAATSTS